MKNESLHVGTLHSYQRFYRKDRDYDSAWIMSQVSDWCKKFGYQYSVINVAEKDFASDRLIIKYYAQFDTEEIKVHYSLTHDGIYQIEDYI